MIDSVSFLKLKHIQDGTLFMTHMTDIVLDKANILYLLNSYERSVQYILFLSYNLNLMYSKNFSIIRSQSNRPDDKKFRILDWDEFVVTLDSFCDMSFEDEGRLPVTYSQKMKLAAIYVFKNSILDFKHKLDVIDYAPMISLNIEDSDFEPFIDYCKNMQRASNAEYKSKERDDMPF